MVTLTRMRSSKKHRPRQFEYALWRLVTVFICLFSISGNANTIDHGFVVVLENINERLYDISGDVSRARKENRSQLIFDANLQTCFDNLFGDVNMIFSMTYSTRLIASISADMTAVPDESYVNKILADQLRIDLSYFEKARALMNETANLCPNNDVVVSRTQRSIILLDELVVAMRSAQSTRFILSR